jgi:two-component system sensor histidine kinase/response regulator
VPGPAAAPDPRGEPLLRLQHQGARLLLAEDNEINREVALELLSSAGLTVDTAVDGRQAVAMARQQRYDLVLMDVQMPHMDGLEATRAHAPAAGLARRAGAGDDGQRLRRRPARL